MTQVFISYAHVSPDQELAATLHRALEANALSVFVDSNIRLGRNWVEEIDNQLRNSTHFVALLSSASAKSDMVRREIAIAYKLRKTNSLNIFPVRLDFDEELPYELAAYLDLIQYVVWRKGQPFDPICQTIIEAIQGSAPYRSASPSAGFKAPAAYVFTRSELDMLSSQLARYIGPAARLVVDRAAKKATTWDQIYDLLAAEVPDGEERRSFRASRFKRSVSL